AEIDGGATPFTLCGYLGGYATQSDDVTVTVRFESDSAVELATAAIGPVTPDERGGLTGLALRTTTGTVPVGTRAAAVSMTFELVTGFYIDGIADNLWLTLGGCPEIPTTTTTSTSTTITTRTTTTTSSATPTTTPNTAPT